ncbi:hypothetical protein PORCRE_212 [Porphyromonas crevioricanis JCM 15906]|uniref:Uncharacterized protein n=1 Tax=Porphyromonas crevioricanis JCM 15906 TaxID=1305617 RepID=S4N9B0_9PORP|nr:hypothetical protein PORCRE_212 [Porphyromonas crevioricanis JCM 15906]
MVVFRKSFFIAVVNKILQFFLCQRGERYVWGKRFEAMS